MNKKKTLHRKQHLIHGKKHNLQKKTKNNK